MLTIKRIQKDIKKNLDLKDCSWQFRGKTFYSVPKVYSHHIFLGGEFENDFPYPGPGQKFLKIGTGAGVYAITSALNGADTVATDIS